MSKGPSRQGNITQTTINPTQQAHLPVLQTGWNASQNLYQNSPYGYYPGQTMADQNNWLNTGYNNLANTGSSIDQTLRPLFNSVLGSAAGNGINGIYNSPAFAGLSDIGSGGNAYLRQ